MEESDDLDDIDHEEATAITQAFLQFTNLFQQYVREMNPELWKRAVDYSKTFIDVEGVEFTYVDNTGCTADGQED